MSLLARVQRFARRHELWRPETRIVAAVSGGSDSVALLLLLRDLHVRGELVLDAVAHLNHGIRAGCTDQDEEFCRALAARLALPFECGRVDVPTRARVDGVSIEVAARHARQEFLEHIRQTRAADCVATAHTEDDQAETVLLHMVRGAGLRGLSGIAPAGDGRIRPLLTCCRRDLQDELNGRNEPWREDATNADISNPRNRMRHEVLPYLEEHFNPLARAALSRLADLARADDRLLERDAALATLHLVKAEGDSVRVDAEALNAMPESLSRRVVRDALDRVRRGGAFGLDDVELVKAVAAGECGAGDLSGVRVEHSGQSVVLIKQGHVRSPATPFRLELTIPGTVELPVSGWVLEAAGPQAAPEGSPGKGSQKGLSAHRLSKERQSREVEIDAAGLGATLVVRSRQPGDRIRPLGLSGQKKLQDLFVDRKVSREERDRVPVVTDARGRIVWVAGHAIGEAFRVTDHTKAVIILKLRRI